MRALLELSHGQDAGAWLHQYEQGQVPDAWPYGLNRMSHYGVDLVARPPVASSAGRRLSEIVNGRCGGLNWGEALKALPRSHRRDLDAVVCWDERCGIPALARETLSRGLPVATGVVWLADEAEADPRAVRLGRRWMPRAGAVWVLSTAMVTVLADRFGLDRRRVHYVPFGIDADFFGHQQYEPDSQLVVSAGNDRHRDHRLLVSAIGMVRASHPRARLQIATRLPITLPQQSGTSAQSLDHRGMRSLMGRAAVVAVATVPNVHVSGITVALEAMASARPVVISDTPGMADYVVHGETGLLVPPGDAHAMSNALAGLLADPAAALAMGQAGYERVQRHYTTEHQARRLAELVSAL